MNRCGLRSNYLHTSYQAQIFCCEIRPNSSVRKISQNYGAKAGCLAASSVGERRGLRTAAQTVKGPQTSVMGTMTFVIGTESNNSFAAATVITLDAHNLFTTAFQGQNLTSSVIASGSDAILFPDSLMGGFRCFADALPPASSLAAYRVASLGNPYLSASVALSIDSVGKLARRPRRNRAVPGRIPAPLSGQACVPQRFRQHPHLGRGNRLRRKSGVLRSTSVDQLARSPLTTRCYWVG